MNIEYYKRLSQAFVVEPDNLEKLIAICEKYIGAVNIHIACNDNTSRKFSKLEGLICYDNINSQMIQEIHLTANSEDNSESVKIGLGDVAFHNFPFFKTNVLIDIEAHEDNIYTFKSEILNQISEMRPWYNFVAAINVFFSLLFFVYFLLFATLISDFFLDLQLYSSIVSSESKTHISIIKMASISVLFFVIIIGGIFCFNKAKVTLFPKSFFRIGRQDAKFAILDRCRWSIITAIVTIVIGAVYFIINRIF